MKFIAPLILFFVATCANAKQRTYRGSSPAHTVVRTFLGISLTDSIDFIKWKVVIEGNQYQLDCWYGLAKAGTNGFVDGKTVNFSGQLTKENLYYSLQKSNKVFYLLHINSNLLHLLDENKNMLVGNGGYSYTLNRESPVKTAAFNLSYQQAVPAASMAFEGRTPCQELSKMMELNKGPECNKMKWYVLLYTDPKTGHPTYYLKGGRGYKKETMYKGNWEIIKDKAGRLIYKLDPEKQNAAVYLLKGDDNILFFTDREGNLLVGNEDFSYTLNRTKER